ncbi:MAG: hypothetical protein ACK5OX_02610 [Desertimonas sp.]
MGSLILLIVAAVWIAVLVPPLLRSRLENRPNSSVSDFRDQLSSLQKAVPTTRAGSMRAMARPLAPSSLARPAAPGRPLRSGVTLASGGSTRSPRQQAALAPRGPESPRQDGVRRARVSDASMRSHGRLSSVAERDEAKRRRANVLFVLGVVAACSLFLAITTKTTGVAWVAGLSCISLVGYVFLLAQQANAARPIDRTRRSPSGVRQHGQRPRDDERSMRADDEARTPMRTRQYRGERAAHQDRRPLDDDRDRAERTYRAERGERLERREFDEFTQRRVRAQRARTPDPAPRPRPRPDAVDRDGWDDELWGEQRAPRARPSRNSRAQLTRPVRDQLADRRREPARPRSWSEDPHPSGVVYGDPLFMSREQPVVRRRRPATRPRATEWVPAG